VDAMTRFSGSFSFVVVHAIWFALWIVVNLIPSLTLDPFPFGLLTLAVSLEAIFLSTFVLISQNRQADVDDARAREDFEINVYAEVLSQLTAEQVGVDMTRVHQLVQKRLANSTRSASGDAEGTSPAPVSPPITT